VHSGKDLPTKLPDGLVEGGFLEREDPRDAFLSRDGASLMDLPAGAVVGTASLRRQAMVRRLRPDLKVVLLRGNVQTRLAKLQSGEVDATILALAGLNRLGLAHAATSVLEPTLFLPAVAQGAIGLVARAGDARTAAAVSAIAHAPTTTAVTAERAFLTVLDGSCRTPIAGHAVVRGGEVAFRGLVLRVDGSESYESRRAGLVSQAATLGADAGHDILSRAPSDILAH
jgi:hydroxymethylbilane synthase